MLLVMVSAAAAVIVYRFLTNLASVNYEPGMRPLFSPLGLLGAVIPTCWWNPGLKWVWEWRKTNFRSYKYDVVSLVPLLIGEPFYYTCSVDAVKQLLNKSRRLVCLWGDNVISASGDIWKRHRRIMAPAFTRKVRYSIVVAETIATYWEMLAAEGWEALQSVEVANVNDLPQKFALIIIARCGFGFRMPWGDVPTTDGEMSFGESLTRVSESAITRLVLPRWVYRLPIRKVKVLDQAWKTLRIFMQRFTETRQTELNGITDKNAQTGDIFSRLVSALDVDETSKLGLVQS
ncbi:cytochrome P450 [Mycena crocata]|nr:cytochrome P450 [Mycena crocata]